MSSETKVVSGPQNAKGLEAEPYTDTKLDPGGPQGIKVADNIVVTQATPSKALRAELMKLSNQLDNNVLVRLANIKCIYTYAFNSKKELIGFAIVTPATCNQVNSDINKTLVINYLRFLSVKDQDNTTRNDLLNALGVNIPNLVRLDIIDDEAKDKKTANFWTWLRPINVSNVQKTKIKLPKPSNMRTGEAYQRLYYNLPRASKYTATPISKDNYELAQDYLAESKFDLTFKPTKQELIAYTRYLNLYLIKEGDNKALVGLLPAPLNNLKTLYVSFYYGSDKLLPCVLDMAKDYDLLCGHTIGSYSNESLVSIKAFTQNGFYFNNPVHQSDSFKTCLPL